MTRVTRPDGRIVLLDVDQPPCVDFGTPEMAALFRRLRGFERARRTAPPFRGAPGRQLVQAGVQDVVAQPLCVPLDLQALLATWIDDPEAALGAGVLSRQNWDGFLAHPHSLEASGALTAYYTVVLASGRVA
ncbi:hypothetical protein [Deinococcus hohokamensis]|uniref:Uncharacterized protein n=1 Tax=Deinococcus hohokamensis TaxID=309883 RepID=A0ABV9IAP5_9DEIO